MAALQLGMRVLVTGAGMAGLTAARALRDRGHTVLVADKSQVPGGRVATRRVVAAGQIFQFDHGAQYFTVRDPRFAEVVDRWAEARLVRPWRARLATFDSEGRDEVEDGVTRWVGVPEMSTLGRALAETLDVRYGTRIDRLVRDTAGLWLAAVREGGEVGPFDAAVVAVPAPQAVPLLAEAPELAAVAAGVSMHPCWAALAAFDEPVPVRFDAAWVLHSALGWIARDASKPRRARAETWVLHASASWSRAHGNARPDAVGPFLLRAFEELVPRGLPAPLHLDVQRWQYAAADPPLARRVLADPDRRLAVCGDWLLGNRVESAFLSGLAAAEVLA